MYLKVSVSMPEKVVDTQVILENSHRESKLDVSIDDQVSVKKSNSDLDILITALEVIN